MPHIALRLFTLRRVVAFAVRCWLCEGDGCVWEDEDEETEVVDWMSDEVGGIVKYGRKKEDVDDVGEMPMHASRCTAQSWTSRPMSDGKHDGL